MGGGLGARAHRKVVGMAESRRPTPHFTSMPAPQVDPTSIFTMRNRPPNRMIDQIAGSDLGEIWEPQETPRRPPGDPPETPRRLLGDMMMMMIDDD